ncbi:lamin tail domain-containing protein [Parapedobacter pyrenivorans]|uniref:lamin tail domain-containing protein n=1 Tax=Parapedobacter pyrenivorans TaxID=1305674 RepID=UPI003340A299
MKHTVFLLFGLWSLFPNGQFNFWEPSTEGLNRPKWPTAKLVPDDTTGVSFFDDFSGNWSSQWHGDVASFDTTVGGLGPVEHATAPVSITIPSPRVRNTVWEAGVQVNGAFSTSNYVRLYLAATKSSPHEPQTGYHLQIDGVNDYHVYRLWRQNGRTRSIVFESGPISNQTDAFRARIRITCTSNGLWQLLTDEYDSGSFAVVSDKDGEPNVMDDTYINGTYSGYFVNFSPTRWRDFKIDYLLIKPLDPTAESNPGHAVQPGDILINEILSNPMPGGVDFIELYNYSNKAVNLSQIDIANINASGVVGVRQKIANHALFLHPNEYSVLTTKPAIVKQHYPKSDLRTFIEMPTLPNFNNETGGVVLYSDSSVIDSLFYMSAMQSPFIINHEGVSLERQHFSEPTNAPGNFQSAATSIGGATPGYQNSRHPAEVTEDELFLTSKTFSPDNDGFEDYLEINYHFGESGFMANIDIYTDEGLLVRKLKRNQSLATQGKISWDGLTDANQRLPLGIYVAVIEIYSAKGLRKMYRKSFVLAAKL